MYHFPANTFVAGFIGSPTMNMVPGNIEAIDGRPHACLAEGLAVTLPHAAPLAPGRQVIVGVRPEDLTLVDGAAAEPGLWRVCGRIGVVEPLGSETLVSVEIEGHELTGIAKGRAEPATGTVAEFAFNLENLHLFDHEFGAAIR